MKVGDAAAATARLSGRNHMAYLSASRTIVGKQFADRYCAGAPPPLTGPGSGLTRLAPARRRAMLPCSVRHRLRAGRGATRWYAHGKRVASPGGKRLLHGSHLTGRRNRGTVGSDANSRNYHVQEESMALVFAGIGAGRRTSRFPATTSGCSMIAWSGSVSSPGMASSSAMSSLMIPRS